jgi:DNA-binding transcriptional LysR family regulator
MKIDTLGVQAFAAIAEHAGFRQAAAALHISQTALTRRLQNLESSLGVKLVERTTRVVALTKVGRDFFPQAKRLLMELTEALTQIQGIGKTSGGSVCIACVPTAGVQFLPHIIKEYSSAYPDNKITILDHLSSEVTSAVLRREAEFGVNIAGQYHPDLMSETFLQDQFVLICRDDHPLAKRKKLSWQQLAPFPLIFAGEISANRSLLDLSLSKNLRLNTLYEVQRSSTTVGLVAAGVAAAVVPRLAIQQGAYPRIRMISLTEPVVSRSLVLITRRAANLSPAAQALYNLIRKQSLPAA